MHPSEVPPFSQPDDCFPERRGAFTVAGPLRCRWLATPLNRGTRDVSDASAVQMLTDDVSRLEWRQLYSPNQMMPKLLMRAALVSLRLMQATSTQYLCCALNQHLTSADEERDIFTWPRSKRSSKRLETSNPRGQPERRRRGPLCGRPSHRKMTSWLRHGWT
jgi:hypothetical protein